MSWQPIETAPKDGTQIIGFWPSFNKGFRVQITHYIVTEHRNHGKITYADEYWFADIIGSSIIKRPAPSHWMPVPEDEP